MTENDPWVPISTMLHEFGCEDPLKDLTKSLQVVASPLLEVSGDKVKRVTPVTRKADEDECTIYVENISQEM